MSDRSRVIQASLERGATRLMALTLAQVAAVGGVNFQTAKQMAPHIDKPGGGRYHPKSISRSLRDAQRRGFVTITRYYSGQKVPRARHRTAHGTTLKVLNWKAYGFRSSLSRSERRKMVRAVEVIDRKRERRRSAIERTAAPRYSAPVPAPPLPRELAELAGEFERAMEHRWSDESNGQGERAGSVASGTAAGPDPPD